MSIYKPSELLRFLESLGTSPKKRLSQNFLIDQNVLNKIIEEANVSKEDVILEIGPGPGSLTEKLLARGATVFAVEKDPILAKALNRLQTKDTRLHIFEEDILKFCFEKLPQKQPLKVIANLPYHLTTPIISQLIQKKELFSLIVVMVQEEVARRMTAVLNTAEYSSWTVFLEFFSQVSYAFFVKRNCFYPAPNVDSAIVTIKPKLPPKIHSKEAFFSMVRAAFSQRRKMLRASLKAKYTQEGLLKALKTAQIKETQRPQELSLHAFLTLYKALEEQDHTNEKKS